MKISIIVVVTKKKSGIWAAREDGKLKRCGVGGRVVKKCKSQVATFTFCERPWFWETERRERDSPTSATSRGK
jgi:hypothetical protein